MRITVLGLGYIGLPTASLLADKGYEVTGVDVNQRVVDTINKGDVHIVEKNLDEVVRKSVGSGKLTASLIPGVSDIYMVAVPTPFGANHEPDISYVQSAVSSIVPHLQEGNAVIIESTSPIGTTEKMHSLILSKRPDLKDKFFMAYCPERVLPGNILHELEHNDRVVGGINLESTRIVEEFYGKTIQGKVHGTNARTAEMCKLVENASRDSQIAFANELSMICHEADINVSELISLANKHPRVNILQPGVGVGGHCIAVDPWFIIKEYKDAKLMQTAREVNLYKTKWVAGQITAKMEEFRHKEGREPNVACLGLTYKANIDDIRESPALDIVKELGIKHGELVIAVDPYVSTIQDITITDLKNVWNCDILAILVAHNEFMQLKSQYPTKVILDYCNLG